MSDCCSSDGDRPGAAPKRHRCPVDGKEYGQVSRTTIRHHIKRPWEWAGKDQGYYFCSDPACDVVYFGLDGSTIDRSSVRAPIGLKEGTDDALVCHCFGITRSDALRDPALKAFVIEETRRKTCACETRNPSGRCCLADFPD
mgnify:CR=1 FL=1